MSELDGDHWEWVGEVDLELVSYEFYIAGIWRDLRDDSLWFGTDSGCSCPSPWEYHTGEDLTPIKNLVDFDLVFSDYDLDQRASSEMTYLRKKVEELL